MRRFAVAAAVAGAMALAACSASSSVTSPTAAASTRRTHSTPSPTHNPERDQLVQPDHVVLVIMENHSYRDIVGSAQAPFINHTIVPNSIDLTSMRANSSPSLPNYVWISAGSDCGSAGSDSAWDRACTSVFDQMAAKGVRWTTYVEDYPGDADVCSTVTSSDAAPNNYARKHNPPLLFTSTSSGAACTDQVRDFPGDTVNDNAGPAVNFEGVKLPSLSIVVPNLCHDMHNSTARCGSAGGGIAAGDEWLSSNWRALIDDAGANGIVIVTWDEGSGSPTIPTFLAGQNLPGVGSTDGYAYDHGSTLRAIEDAFGLACLQEACTARPLPVQVRVGS